MDARVPAGIPAVTVGLTSRVPGGMRDQVALFPVVAVGRVGGPGGAGAATALAGGG